MSRSYCKPHEKYDPEEWFYEKWYHYSKKHSGSGYSGRLSRTHRKMINSKRRDSDKRELYKEVNLIDYHGKYSKWNCRDSNPMWSW